MRSSVRSATRAVAAFALVRLVCLGVFWAVAARQGRAPLRVLSQWDGQWYRGIAEHGYGLLRLHPDGRLLADYAFFPLLPLLERGVGALTGLAAVHAGLLVSVAASLVAAAGIHRVTTELYGDRVALVTVLLWAALPVAAVQWMPYSESLFTALAAWAVQRALRRDWVGAGLLAALAGLTRPVGVAVAAAVAVPALLLLVRRRRERLRWDRSDLAAAVGALLAPLGTLGYLAWVGLERGDPLGYFHVASGWGNSFDGGVAFARWTVEQLRTPPYVGGVALCAAVVVLVWLTVLSIRQRQPLPLLVLTVVVVAMTLTTSGYFGSRPRYLLPAFGLLLPVARLLAARPRAQRLGALGLLVAGSVAWSAVWLLGPGPP